MKRITIGMLLALWPVVVSAQAPREAMKVIEKMSPGEFARVGDLLLTLNQKEAGEPNEDGHYPARAVSGGFSVLMPVPFNDLTIVSPVKDGTTVTSDTVGGIHRAGSATGSANGSVFTKAMHPVYSIQRVKRLCAATLQALTARCRA